MHKEKYLLIQGINGDIESAKRFNEAKLTSTITLDIILDILSNQDLSSCPEDVLIPIQNALLFLPSKQRKLLISNLLRASNNVAATTLLAFILSEKSKLNKKELKHLEDIKQFLIKRSEKYNDPKATNALGLIEEDRYKAFKHYRKAAKLGDKYAIANLSYMYSDGIFVKQDNDMALKLLKKSVDLGNVNALTHLALIYKNGQCGLKKDFMKSCEIFQSAAEKGDIQAMFHLAKMYKKGCGVQQNYEKCIMLLNRAGDLGSIRAIFKLGKMHKAGDGTEKDIVKAIKYFKIAARKGDLQAMLKLAVMYESGTHIKQNPNKAVRLYKRAISEHDSIRAMYNLAWLYYDGDIIEQNFKKARKLFKKAADKDHSYAMNSLGQMYNRGDGGVKNFKIAKKYFRRSAALDNPVALNNLGMMYELGKGVKKNSKKAFVLFEKSAMLNEPIGMTNLSYMYETGSGVSQSYYLAVKWNYRAFNKKSSSSYAKSYIALRNLLDSLDPNTVKQCIKSSVEIIENIDRIEFNKEKKSKTTKKSIKAALFKHGIIAKKVKKDDIFKQISNDSKKIINVTEMRKLLKKIYMNGQDGQNKQSFRYILAKVFIERSGFLSTELKYFVDNPPLLVNAVRYLLMPGEMALADIKEHADKISTVINNGKNNTFLHKIPCELLAKISMYCITPANRNKSEVRSFTEEEHYDATAVLGTRTHFA